LANKLLKDGSKSSISEIANNLEKFENIDHQWLIEKLLAIGKGHVIANNLEKFKGIDHQWLAYELFKIKQGDAITFNLEKFEGIDHKWLAAELHNSEEDYLIANNLEKFEGIDHQQLAIDLVKVGNGRAIANNLEKFEGIDRQWLANELLKSKDGSLVAENLEKFEGIDHQQLAKELATSGAQSIIIDNLEKFDNIDHQRLVEELIENKMESLIVENLEKLDNIVDIDWEKIINRGLLTWRHLLKILTFPNFLSHKIQVLLVFKLFEVNRNYFFKNIESISKSIGYDIANNHSVFEHLPDKSVENMTTFYLKNRYYKSFLGLINNFDLEASQLNLKWEDLLNDLILLINDNNIARAQSLILVLEKLFPEKKIELNNVKKSLITNQNSEQTISREKFEEIDTSNEIFKYYLSLLLKSKYRQLRPLSPKELTRKIEYPIRSLFNKLREYMIVAVSSEFQHSRNMDGMFGIKTTNANLYSTGAAEEIRVFFERAEKDFISLDSYLGTSWGGTNWATIAEYGRKIWGDQVATDLEKQIFLLNIVIGIQHNSGLFFDKDKNRVKINNPVLEKLLDFEASKNHQFFDFLRYGLGNGIISREEYNYYLDLDEELSRYQGLNPQEISKHSLDQSVNREMGLILSNPKIPPEIKRVVSASFDKKEGFFRERSGFVLLGRLLKTMNPEWQEYSGVMKKYQDSENIIYNITIEGYELGFWYKNGALKDITNVFDLRKLKPELSKVLNKPIVQAQLNYLREGD
jgi:hypothetical protein